MELLFGSRHKVNRDVKGQREAPEFRSELASRVVVSTVLAAILAYCHPDLSLEAKLGNAAEPYSTTEWFLVCGLMGVWHHIWESGLGSKILGQQWMPKFVAAPSNLRFVRRECLGYI